CATCLRNCLSMRSLRLPISFLSRETILVSSMQTCYEGRKSTCLYGLADKSAGKRYSLTHLSSDGLSHFGGISYQAIWCLLLGQKQGGIQGVSGHAHFKMQV